MDANTYKKSVSIHTYLGTYLGTYLWYLPVVADVVVCAVAV